MSARTIDTTPGSGEPVGSENTRTRLLSTAVHLFAEHGFAGTSLQMIADELGVTKAAVYYHFKTKAEIAEASVQEAIDELEGTVEAAEAERRRNAQVELMLSGVIDLILRHRSLLALVASDQGLMRAIIEQGTQMTQVKQRLLAVLAGPEPDDRTRVAISVVMPGLMMCGSSPDLADLDEDELREHLLDVGLRALGRPRRRSSSA